MLKKIIIRHIDIYSKTYIIIAILFLIGISLGVLYTNSMDDKSLFKSKEFFTEFQKTIDNTESFNFKENIISSFIKELKFEGIIFIITCTIILGDAVYLLILYKGFSLAYVMSSAIKVYGTKKGLLFSFLTLGISNIFCIPCIIFFSVYCINFIKKIKNKNMNLKIEYGKFIVVFVIILLISTIFETINLDFSYKMLKKLHFFY